jgi:hypothetical protein
MISKNKVIQRIVEKVNEAKNKVNNNRFPNHFRFEYIPNKVACIPEKHKYTSILVVNAVCDQSDTMINIFQELKEEFPFIGMHKFFFNDYAFTIESSEEQKYLMLYNISHKNFDNERQRKISELKSAGINIKIFNECIYDSETLQRLWRYSGVSIWVPEKDYMTALTIFNYEGLCGLPGHDKTTVAELKRWYDHMITRPLCQLYEGDFEREVSQVS